MPHTVSVKKLLPDEFSPLVFYRSGCGPFVLLYLERLANIVYVKQ